MTGDPPAQAPEPDAAAEAKRRDIERAVFERRTATDKAAEDEQGAPVKPLGEA